MSTDEVDKLFFILDLILAELKKFNNALEELRE